MAMQEYGGGMAHDTHGDRTFASRLRTVEETCPECGFTGAILGSAWRTTAGRHPRTGNAVYELRCPDCGETTSVEPTF